MPNELIRSNFHDILPSEKRKVYKGVHRLPFVGLFLKGMENIHAILLVNT